MEESGLRRRAHTKPRTATLWPFTEQAADLCPEDTKTAAHRLPVLPRPRSRGPMGGSPAFPAAGLWGDVSKPFARSKGRWGDRRAAVHALPRGRVAGPRSAHSPHTTRSAEASSTPRELVARQV